MQTPVLLSKFAVPFLNSLGILKKGTAFLLVFSESYQFIYADRPEHRRVRMLSDAPAFFVIRKDLFIQIDGREKHV